MGMGMRAVLVIAAVLGAAAITAAPAVAAYSFDEPLTVGSTGRDVLHLEVRIAGWFPSHSQTSLEVDRTFDDKTARAVAAFQKHYGITVDGVAGPDTYDVLAKLEDEDGSTAHFDFAEFQQNRNPSCSRAANKYAGTFDGGKVSSWKVRHNIMKLMWRLEVIRAKGNDRPIAITSGFRSVAYNECIGGASLSQHMYGTAADSVMAKTSNREERDIARASQFEGIGCYSSQTHNHFDLRLENPDLDGAHFWWWPDQDRYGRDLADDGTACYGEERSAQRAPLPVAAVERLESGHEPFLNGDD
jgi:uncharacterized protein YcbK (DUF882 family)